MQRGDGRCMADSEVEAAEGDREIARSFFVEGKEGGWRIRGVLGGICE